MISAGAMHDTNTNDDELSLLQDGMGDLGIGGIAGTSIGTRSMDALNFDESGDDTQGGTQGDAAMADFSQMQSIIAQYVPDRLEMEMNAEALKYMKSHTEPLLMDHTNTPLLMDHTNTHTRVEQDASPSPYNTLNPSPYNTLNPSPSNTLNPSPSNTLNLSLTVGSNRNSTAPSVYAPPTEGRRPVANLMRRKTVGNAQYGKGKLKALSNVPSALISPDKNMFVRNTSSFHKKKVYIFIII
jgi:hypothetical protein